LGVIVLRWEQPQLERPYKTLLFPITPLIFIVANAWFMYFLFQDKKDEALIGLSILISGFIFYLVSGQFQKKVSSK